MDVTKLEGQKVGEYKLIRLIGRGAMSVVYEAQSLDGLKAVKLPTHMDHFDKIRTEAHAGKFLNHPNIARIEGMDTWEGFPFLVMELVRGSTLKQLTEALREKGQVWLPETVESVGKQLLSAIEHSHAYKSAEVKCILHCDVRPNNILVDTGLNVKLTDFGIGRVIFGLEPHQYSTLPRDAEAEYGQETVIFPTDFYPSNSKERKNPTPRVDLYMVSNCMAYMLLGDLPHGDMPPGSLASGDYCYLEHVIRTGRSYHESERYQSATAMLRALEQGSEATPHGNSITGNYSHDMIVFREVVMTLDKLRRENPLDFNFSDRNIYELKNLLMDNMQTKLDCAPAEIMKVFEQYYLRNRSEKFFEDHAKEIDWLLTQFRQ